MEDQTETKLDSSQTNLESSESSSSLTKDVYFWDAPETSKGKTTRESRSRCPWSVLEYSIIFESLATFLSHYFKKFCCKNVQS